MSNFLLFLIKNKWIVNAKVDRAIVPRYRPFEKTGSNSSLFLEPKYRKKVEAYKNTPEYKELLQQVKVSSEALEAVTKRLKTQIDNYELGIKKLQKMGLKVNSGMTPSDQYRDFKEWQAARAKKTCIDFNNLEFLKSLEKDVPKKSKA